MTNRNLKKMTSAELFNEFLRLALAHSQAMWGINGSAMRRLYWKLDLVAKELRSRPGDARRILVALHGHQDAGVRLQAAEATLAVDPVGARATLQQICDRKEQPYAGYAGFTLLGLDRGEYVPV